MQDITVLWIGKETVNMCLFMLDMFLEPRSILGETQTQHKL